MKKTVYVTGLFLFFNLIISCSDDFLLKNNDNLYILSDTLYLNNNQDNVETSLQLPGSVNSDYTIIMQPKWLSFESMHGIVTGGNVSLSFAILKENITPGYQTQYATIMLDIENTGLFSFIVAYTNTGSPTLQCSSSNLNFEMSGSTTFTVSNTSEGILKWNITGIPDWLLLSETSGTLYFGNSITITASLDFDNITMEEELEETIQINSNSVAGSFGLTVHVSPTAIMPSEVVKIDGIVTDAEYNHESGIMVICTKLPGSLIIFNTRDNSSNTILLDKTPNCVSLSEDGHKAVIGYSVSSVSYIDIDTHEITGDYSINCIPYDIVLGDNGWCYITPSVDQWVYFRNLNLNTGELIVGKNWSTVYEKTIIKKVQGKPFLAGSRTTVSPSGLLIFDITRGVSSDTISYYHASIGKFWVSVDGTRLLPTINMYIICRNTIYSFIPTLLHFMVRLNHHFTTSLPLTNVRLSIVFLPLPPITTILQVINRS